MTSHPSFILHEAERRLERSSHLFRRSVHCAFDSGALTITGAVPSFHLKQTAQALVADIDGVSRVRNEVQVINPCGISSEPQGAPR